MMDQQNFEAARPASADPAVAAQLCAAGSIGPSPPAAHKTSTAISRTCPRPQVEGFGRDEYLKKSRRPERTDHPPHQARQELFIRSRQRHADPPHRHHQAPELDGGAPGLCRSPLRPRSDLASAGGRPRCRGPAAIPLSFRLGKGPRAAQGAPAGAAGRGLAENPPQRLGASVRRRADPRIRAVGGDRTDRAHRDPSGQRILRPPQRHPRRHHAAQSPMSCWKTTAWC